MKSSGDADQSCNLECVKRDTLQHFEGPVKVILVDPPAEDLEKNIWETAFLGIANLLIGGVVLTTLYFSYICRLPIFISAHIAACTAGFQLFLPNAFLMLNPNFGGSTQLKCQQRRSQHVYLIYIALIFGVTGGLHICAHISIFVMPYNPHTVTGIFALTTSLPTFIIGPLLWYNDICSDIGATRLRIMKYVHAGLGVSSFISSSICLVTSYFKPSFQKWSDIIHITELPGVLSVFVIIYTGLIIKGVGWQMKYHNTGDMPPQPTD